MDCVGWILTRNAMDDERSGRVERAIARVEDVYGWKPLCGSFLYVC